MRGGQVLGSSLEAHVLRSDNSALAKDCRKEMKAVTARLGKLGRKVPPRSAARCSPHCGCRPHAGALVWIAVDPGKSVDTARGPRSIQDYTERRSLRTELRALQKEERKRQERAVTEVIRNAQVKSPSPITECTLPRLHLQARFDSGAVCGVVGLLQ